MRGFFRYPGGKAKLRGRVLGRLNVQGLSRPEYREPFFGGGGIGLAYLFGNKNRPAARRVWLNDKDVGVSCLWSAVIRYPNNLKSLVRRFVPESYFGTEPKVVFDELRQELSGRQKVGKPSNVHGVVDVGFKKLVIHQCSYSGLGMMSGGPLGGAAQKSRYNIGCRWYPDHICRSVDKLCRQFGDLEVRYGGCTCLDFAELLGDGNYVTYLDPPYYKKGNSLYYCGFTTDDHLRLRDRLAGASEWAWVLSYDAHHQVKRMYEFADIEIVSEVPYSITSLVSPAGGKNLAVTKNEFIITPRKVT